MTLTNHDLLLTKQLTQLNELRIPNWQIAKITKLLEREPELHNDDVCERFGISVNIIQQIRSGRYVKMDDPDEQVPERCDICGGLVFLPCILCQEVVR